MSKRRTAPQHSGLRLLDVEHAEAALVEHYAQLVRLVYVTLPRRSGRHGRVLTAHRVVQGTLPHRGLAIPGRTPEPADGTGTPGAVEGADAYDALRTRALRAARAHDTRSGRPLARPWARRNLPAVWGLRVFPQSGGADELLLDRALAEADWPVRAAFALLQLERLRPDEAVRVLRDTGVDDPERALEAAHTLAATTAPADLPAPEPPRPPAVPAAGSPTGSPAAPAADAQPSTPPDAPTTAPRPTPESAADAPPAPPHVPSAAPASDPSADRADPAGLPPAPPDPDTDADRPADPPAPVLLAAEFDPCLLHARPTDLLRRRHRMRAAGTAALLLTAAVTAAALTLPGVTDGGGGGGDRAVDDGRPAPVSRVTRVDQLVRTPADVWADTARVDFTAWPARGARAGDRPLLSRALKAWADPAWRGRRTAEPGAAATGTGRPPHLLYAADVDGRAVVVLQDGLTTVRYSEPLRGDTPPELVAALTDGADVTTAAALVVSRTPDSVRLLLAPWIAEAGVRDLLAPDTPVRAVERSDDGVTAPLPLPPAAGECRSRPVVQLRSSARIVEDHAFLLADLGGLSPAHLTYMPAPTPGVRPRPPQEATGPAGLQGWARGACRLDGLRDQGVRAVNHWVFATQSLPERAGQGTWVCARADTWRGPGQVEYLFLGPDGGPARRAGVRRDTAECSRFGQNVLADTRWRAPSGSWYLLAAGSRSVARVETDAPRRAAADGRFLAVRADEGTRAEVRGRLPDGSEVRAAG
ncbi:hypothetical protein ACFWNK_32445 [Streptomyces sp. NPDC058417]|uniref:hypothetical protein n=2 Tax=Streptomyces TaxID=1883 RepID=UPI003648209D